MKFETDDIYAADAFKNCVGKKVPFKDEEGNVIGEATVLDESGSFEIKIFGETNE